MDGSLPIALHTVVIDCPDIRALSGFYLSLLGWEKVFEDEEWVDIRPPGGGVVLGFQQNDAFVPPVWPEQPNAQQQMLHLDFAVAPARMEQSVRHALACGARMAPVQFSTDEWTTMLDPVGHPFCFVAHPEA